MTSLKIPLFFTRYAIAAFLAPWIVMRFTAPDAAAGIAGKYYKLAGLPGSVTIIVGILWVVLWLAFVTGFKSKWSYAAVGLLHAIGTAFTIPYLFPGGPGYQLLFWAAVPVVGAMWLLWALRDHDTILSFNKGVGASVLR